MPSLVVVGRLNWPLLQLAVVDTRGRKLLWRIERSVEDAVTPAGKVHDFDRLSRVFSQAVQEGRAKVGPLDRMRWVLPPRAVFEQVVRLPPVRREELPDAVRRGVGDWAWAEAETVELRWRPIARTRDSLLVYAAAALSSTVETLLSLAGGAGLRVTAVVSPAHALAAVGPKRETLYVHAEADGSVLVVLARGRRPVWFANETLGPGSNPDEQVRGLLEAAPSHRVSEVVLSGVADTPEIALVVESRGLGGAARVGLPGESAWLMVLGAGLAAVRAVNFLPGGAGDGRRRTGIAGAALIVFLLVELAALWTYSQRVQALVSVRSAETERYLETLKKVERVGQEVAALEQELKKVAPAREQPAQAEFPLVRIYEDLNKHPLRGGFSEIELVSSLQPKEQPASNPGARVVRLAGTAATASEFVVLCDFLSQPPFGDCFIQEVRLRDEGLSFVVLARWER